MTSPGSGVGIPDARQTQQVCVVESAGVCGPAVGERGRGASHVSRGRRGSHPRQAVVGACAGHGVGGGAHGVQQERRGTAVRAPSRVGAVVSRLRNSIIATGESRSAAVRNTSAATAGDASEPAAWHVPDRQPSHRTSGPAGRCPSIKGQSQLAWRELTGSGSATSIKAAGRRRGCRRLRERGRGLGFSPPRPPRAAFRCPEIAVVRR
jgi:hypothetical protein